MVRRERWYWAIHRFWIHYKVLELVEPVQVLVARMMFELYKKQPYCQLTFAYGGNSENEENHPSLRSTMRRCIDAFRPETGRCSFFRIDFSCALTRVFTFCSAMFVSKIELGAMVGNEEGIQMLFRGQ